MTVPGDPERGASHDLKGGGAPVPIGRTDDVETVFKILEHLAANPGRGVALCAVGTPDRTTFERCKN